MSSSMYCRVTDVATNDVRTIPLANDASSWPLLIGTGADCTVRVEAATFAEHEIRVSPNGRNMMLTLLGSNDADAQGRLIKAGTTGRVAGPFEIGGLRFQFGFTPTTPA